MLAARTGSQRQARLDGSERSSNHASSTKADLEGELDVARADVAEARSQAARLRTETQEISIELESCKSAQRELNLLEEQYRDLKEQFHDKTNVTAADARNVSTRYADVDTAQENLVALAAERVDKMRVHHQASADARCRSATGWTGTVVVRGGSVPPSVVPPLPSSLRAVKVPLAHAALSLAHAALSLSPAPRCSSNVLS